MRLAPFACLPRFLFIFGTNSEDPTHAPPVPVLLDNTAALSVANHPKQTPRSRHISLREFRIRDYSGDNNHTQCIRCLWVPTKFNVADFFTKLLASVDFPRLARFLVNAPYNAIADADISVGDHHPSRLPQDFHSSSRAAFRPSLMRMPWSWSTWTSSLPFPMIQE